ncbi:MAG: hypothetical protein KJ939_01190 [Nanoarchaeota archaeon]|nr:hypothetical protein [Nanoarchaeota archaeon]
METRNYTHTRLRNNLFCEGSSVIFEFRVPYNEHKVLVLGMGLNKGNSRSNYLIVPGIIVKYKTEDNGFGFLVSKIQPIKDKKERETLRELVLKETTWSKNINFW